MDRFFAVVSRMKYINRWALMRNTIKENISEHSLETAFIAHALALIRNERFGGNVNAERCALLAMYHDTTEIITGDLPTPIKYYSKEIKGAYNEVEEKAKNTLISYLPDDLKKYYEPLLSPTEEEKELWKLVKGADKLSALIKCIEEVRMGNREFLKAKEATEKSLEQMELPALKVFVDECLPAYYLTLDELG
jgi:5'-deoxynucleotidase